MIKIAVALCLLAGCFLPVATGAPEPATTVGKGKLGAMISGEAPTIDLIANNGSGGNNTYTDTYGASPAAAMRLTLSYGLTDDLDLEIAAEGELWLYFLPLPTGGSIGLRQHLAAGDTFDVAVAARIGGVTSGTATADTNGNATQDEASAEYAAVQAVVQLKRGTVRPLASINLMPFNITRAPEGDPIQRFKGLASSVTFGLMFVGNQVQVGPYATLTNFESTNFSGGFIGSGGLMLAIRQDRNRPHVDPVFQPVGPAPAPYPYGPAPPAYPPPNYPPPTPPGPPPPAQ